MLKPLLKKQFLETLAFFSMSVKNGKRRSKWAMLGFALLMVYAVGASVAMLWFLAQTLCLPLVQAGLAWVYFALAGTLATGLACVGSVFAVKSKLYEAKDNELLLAMPLKAWEILFARMISLYAFSFFFSGIVFIPAAVQYFVVAGVALLPMVFCVLLSFIIPLGALAICALLGWLIALVTARIRAKNLFTTVALIVFLVAYFYLYGKMNEYITYVMQHGEIVGESIRNKLFPFWQLGLAATGKPLGMLFTTLIFVGVFAVAYFILNRTFLYIVTTKRGEIKAAYKEKAHKTRSTFSALLIKECKRYFKNPMIAMNCVLGSVFLLILPIIALFNLDVFTQLAELAEVKGVLALLLCAIVCAVVSMNNITACSVSLEGESLWLVRSLPIKTTTVFSVKLAFHVLATAIPALFCAIFVGILLHVQIGMLLLCCSIVSVFAITCAGLGLMLNLKFPNLRWTNELVAVKQSVSTLAAMFSGIGAVALFIGGYVLFGKYLPAYAYALICLGILSVACAFLFWWIFRKGVHIFESL